MSTNKTPSKNTTVKRNPNTVMDRMWQGAAGAAICFLAFREILRHVKATEGMNYILALVALGFLMYTLIAPQFRR